VIDHLSSYARDYEATKRFYDAALGALGHSLVSEQVATWDADFPERRFCGYGSGRPVFWVIETREDVSPRHVAFAAADRASVEAFHRAALAAGGVDNGAPGPRPVYHEHYFGAFAIDPDGNNIEAVCHASPPR
jgi:catechol 2,3-dioxygenase-like lactoylglutathione lyase family enzyme